MAYVLYSTGLGGSTGDTLVSLYPILATKVLYVDSVTGSDTYDGLQRSRPKATLAGASGAHASAANGTTIVLLSTHTETISTVLTVSLRNVTIVGEGSSSGSPTATIGGGNNSRITISGDSCQLLNIKFTASTTTNVNSIVNVTGKGVRLRGCRFECGANENAGLELTADADYNIVDACTFIATNTGVTTRPSYGMLVGGAPDGLILSGVVFSDGTYGFTNYAFSAASAPNLIAENTSLLLGAEMNTGSSYGYVHVGTSTGGGRVV